MIPALKAEFKKLLTVRSTYFILIFAVAMVVIFAFYSEGYKAVPESLNDPFKLSGEVISGIMALTGLGSVVGMLLMTHEYRYNTINYTLTAARSRTQVILAKIITVSCFAIFFALLIGTLAPVLCYLGIKLHGSTLIHQSFYFRDLAWRVVYTVWGYSIMALLLATIIRAQVGTFVAFFFLPAVEALLGLLLKKNTVYLPFNAINGVLQHAVYQPVPYARSALVATIYLVVGWLVAWQLFLRRDANQ